MNKVFELLKYPRTPHIEGSTLQRGDIDLAVARVEVLKGKTCVVEEKIDGSNCALSFDESGRLCLQSRGHWLVGGPRESHFAQLKSWASTFQGELFTLLGTRYVMYGEWMAAKHTVFYDALEHLFYEFDVYDRKESVFLASAERAAMLSGSGIQSGPILYEGEISGRDQLEGFVGRSLYKSENWRESLVSAALESGQSVARVESETDMSDLAEGVYIKVEEDGVVKERYKWVRAGFLSAILEASGETSTHGLEREHVWNKLREGADLYAWGWRA